MVTENEGVLQGIANGTVCKFRKLVLNQGAELDKIKIYDYWVHAVGTDNTEYIEVQWQDCEHFVGKFPLKPKVGSFRVKHPISEFGAKSRVQTNIELQHLLAVCAIRLNGQTDRVIRTVRIAIRTRTVAIPQ
jgi:hypothetical protein